MSDKYYSQAVRKQIEIARELYGPKREGRLLNTSHVRDYRDDVPRVTQSGGEVSSRDRAEERARDDVSAR